MGVVNVTPDSFSDGGLFLDAGAAVQHGLELVEEGAHLLDVGGESTRPGADPVSADEELARVIPVVERLVAESGVPVSIDTAKAAVAERALAAGAAMVNDVTAMRADPDMAGVVAASGAALCLMHMQGTPRTMQDDPRTRARPGTPRSRQDGRPQPAAAAGAGRAVRARPPGRDRRIPQAVPGDADRPTGGRPGGGDRGRER